MILSQIGTCPDAIISTALFQRGDKTIRVPVIMAGSTNSRSLLTRRTRLRRRPDRGTHDRATINRILDEGFVLHDAMNCRSMEIARMTNKLR